MLPAGVVCDKCNNYFSREVEKPFLESPSIRALRCNQGIPSKRGNIPEISGLVLPGFPAVIQRKLKKQGVDTIITVPPKAFESIASGKSTKLVIPLGGDPPEGKVLSRFMAKAAFESMAQRLLDHSEMFKLWIDDPQMDDLRKHARRGQIEHWPIHVRRIYDADRCVTDGVLPALQTVHESDFLMTEKKEMFFMTAIFGVEMTINVAGPSIDGYLEWLDQNHGASPLYHGKNTIVGPWPVSPPNT